MIPDASMTVHKAKPIQLIAFFENIVSTIEVITPTRRVASGSLHRGMTRASRPWNHAQDARATSNQPTIPLQK